MKHKQRNAVKALCLRFVAMIATVLILVAAAHANYNQTILGDNPVGYWPLNLSVDSHTNSAGNYIATDLSANGNDGAYLNITPARNLVSGPSSSVANAVSFNGTNTYVDLGTGPNISILNFGGLITLEAWVKPAAVQLNPSANIIAKGYDTLASSNEIALKVQNSDSFQGDTYTYQGANGGAAISPSVNGPETTNWNYTVLTYDGANWNLYVNGQLSSTTADTVGALYWNQTWAIGTGTANGLARKLVGDICQAAIYKYALTPAQVETHYLMGVYGTTNIVPIITSQPSSQWVYTNETIAFSVTATSPTQLNYQWQKGAVALGGQTNATLTLTDVQLGDAGNYSVVITNVNGAVTSSVANLSVNLYVVTATNLSAYAQTVLGDEPLGYWPLDLSVDTNTNLTGKYIATDLSPSGNNGVYVHMTPSGNLAAQAAPDGANAASFDGTNAYVDLGSGPHTSLLNFGGQITLEAWVQPAASQPNANGDIIAKGYDSGANYNELELSVDYDYAAMPYSEYFAFHGGTYNSTAGGQGANGTATSDVWTHVVLTYDGEYWNMYQNGQYIGFAYDSVGALDWPQIWAIGAGTADGASRKFAGDICQVAIYNYALTPDQVQAHYAAGTNIINTTPIITSEPTSQWVYTNQTTSFSVTAESTSQLSYQWQKGTMALAGQTNAALTLTDVQLADSGNYSVVITNVYGAVTSSVANLSVNLYVVSATSLSAYARTVLGDEPLGYWPLDLGMDYKTNITGQYLATDLSPSGNNGVYMKMTRAGNLAAHAAPDGANAASFDGTNAYVDLGTGPHKSVLNFGGQITLEAWVQPAASQPNANGDIIAKGDDSGNSYNELELSVDYDYSAMPYSDYFSFHGGTYNVTAGSQGVSGTQTTNVWTHAVLTYDGEYWNMYQNGQYIGFSYDPVGALDWPLAWAIGSGTADGASRKFSGNICQAAIYNYALSPDQVQAHYVAGTTTQVNLTLAIAKSGNSATITWSANAMLQVSTNAAGPYTDVNGATSPYTVPATNKAAFFRLME